MSAGSGDDSLCTVFVAPSGSSNFTTCGSRAAPCDITVALVSALCPPTQGTRVAMLPGLYTKFLILADRAEILTLLEPADENQDPVHWSTPPLGNNPLLAIDSSIWIRNVHFLGNPGDYTWSLSFQAFPSVSNVTLLLRVENCTFQRVFGIHAVVHPGHFEVLVDVQDSVFSDIHASPPVMNSTDMPLVLQSSSSAYCGMGISVFGANSVNVRGCSFENITLNLQYLSESAVSDWSSLLGGAAINIHGLEANIVDTSFDGNTLAITRASAVPVSSVVSGLSYFCGGAVFLDVQAGSFSQGVMTNNTLRVSGGEVDFNVLGGGGLCLASSSVTAFQIQYSNFSGNAAHVHDSQAWTFTVGGGGAILSFTQPVEIGASHFEGNIAIARNLAAIFHPSVLLLDHHQVGNRFGGGALYGTTSKCKTASLCTTRPTYRILLP